SAPLSRDIVWRWRRSTPSKCMRVAPIRSTGVAELALAGNLSFSNISCAPTSETHLLNNYALLAIAALAAHANGNPIGSATTGSVAIRPEVAESSSLGKEREPMKNLLHSGKLLLLDLASTILFLIVYLLTHNVPLSVALGMALGIAQISVQFA